MILTTQKGIKEEKISQIQKQIQKQKRRNQYTVVFKFGSDIDVTQLKQNMQVLQSIPAHIPSNIVFRLNSNIQFPILPKPENQLGCLTVDPHSYNYRVIRYDKKRDVFFLNFEPIQRTFTPLENIKQILLKQHPELWNGFEQFNNKNLEISNFNIVQQEIIHNFEKNISGPMTLYIQKIKNGVVTTIARAMNEKYLQMLGINEEMLQDYIQTTGLFPQSFLGDQTLQWCQNLANVFKANAQLLSGQLQLVNYQGEKFPVLLIPNSFVIFDEEEGSYTEYLFYSYQLDEKWYTRDKAEQNFMDYFNRKQLFDSDYTIDVNGQKRCQFKRI